jgi:ubiquinone biosynthesis protein Coq4
VWAAYRSHPETFFGRILPISKNIEDPVDFYEFLFNSYKETPREKLLEFMNGAPDIEDLKKLPDDELRFVYAELLTHGATLRRKS